MLQLEDAVARILGNLPPPRHERVDLPQAHQRILIESVRSPIDLPAFDNSAMDGYAVRAQDLEAAKQDCPVRLRMIGRVPAGDSFPGELASGQCVRLFTGSPIPKGSDSVVMQEDTRVERDKPDEIVVLDRVSLGENIRCRGQDVSRDALIAQPGERLTAGHLCLLAASGVAHLSVGSQPTVGLLATGSELKEPQETLSPGQIFESNRVGLAALVASCGAKAVVFPVVPDVLESTEQALAKAFSQCDLVITAGGASVGDLDLIRPAFARLGGQLDFWKVSIKPGRPFMFGRVQNKYLFGLPGNPVSAMVTFLLLVRPALLRWQGARSVELPQFPGVLAEPIQNSGGRPHFVRVNFDSAGKVILAGKQASHVLSSFAGARGLVEVLPETVLPAGATVKVKIWEL